MFNRLKFPKHKQVVGGAMPGDTFAHRDPNCPLTFDMVRDGIIGEGHIIRTPFGTRPLFYADYVASGRAYGPIEADIQNHVLPLYANTHTESSLTGRQTTAFREQARALIKAEIGANDEDTLLFCGAGCTGAIDKLIGILRLKLPRGISKYGIDTKIKDKDRPVVFIGPFEHHSNDVQWRESIAEVVTIEQCPGGMIDLADLRENLEIYKDRPLLIGSFSAGSNVTGILCDPAPIAKLLHEYGALAAFDYAAAAPYVKVDMNAGGDANLDAVFISTHKFLGGPGTPGLLGLKKKWAKNKTPTVPGGGTVSYVSQCAQKYLADITHREEGGTPEIVGAIRAGLVFHLRKQIGVENIATKEIEFAKTALKRWGAHPNIHLLGSDTATRLPIFSFLIRDGKNYLHFNFVVALLNDLFGIQARGGCSCAGPYGHRLLGIDNLTSEDFERAISSGIEILKPGWVRVGFNYFYAKGDCEFLLQAVEWIADNGAKLLPLYRYDSANGHWVHRRAGGEHLLSLTDLPIVPDGPNGQAATAAPPPIVSRAVMFDDADKIAGAVKPVDEDICPRLGAAPAHLLWFSLPNANGKS